MSQNSELFTSLRSRGDANLSLHAGNTMLLTTVVMHVVNAAFSGVEARLPSVLVGSGQFADQGC